MKHRETSPAEEAAGYPGGGAPAAEVPEGKRVNRLRGEDEVDESQDLPPEKR